MARMTRISLLGLAVIFSVFVIIQADLYSNDRAYLDLATALQDPLVRNLLKVPTLVLVAAQSAGKSLLISLLAGYGITYSDPLVGTRCPVRYIFRNSTDDGGLEKFVVNGEVVDRHEIADKVKKHMENLKSGVGFTLEDMVIEIFVPDGRNVNIIDLPGFPDPLQPHYNLVKFLIQETVKYPHVVLVGIMNAGDPDPVSCLAKSFVMMLIDVFVDYKVL